MTRTATLESYRERMLRALVYIQSRLDEPLALDELARIACFSPFHFHRVFTGMVGEPVGEYVRRLRLERAARQLRTSARPITDIAFEAGYEAHESFTRAFHTMFGVPPTEFREQRQITTFSGFGLGPNSAPGGSSPEFQIETLAAIRVAFVRHIGPYAAVGSAWGRLMSWAWPKGLVGPHTQLLGIIHDDPQITPPERVRYDAAIPVTESVRPEGDIGVQQIEAGEYAAGLHLGPYDRMGEKYAQICGRWLPLSGREPRDAPALEFYLNSPQSTAPADLRTRLLVPVE